MGFFKGISNTELKSLLETNKAVKTSLMTDVDSLFDEVKTQTEKAERYEKALSEIINHEEIFGYEPTHARCADIAMRALDKVTGEYEHIEFERYKKYVRYFVSKDKLNDIRMAMEERELD